MSLKTGTVRLIGSRPLLMNSDQTVDHRHPLAMLKKEITDKRGTKTEAEIERLMQLKWLGAMHTARFGNDVRPAVPAMNVLRCWQEGGKHMKKGTAIVASLIIDDPSPIQFPHQAICEGPSGWERLYDILGADERPVYADRRAVNLSPNGGKKSRGPSCRPRFDTWAIDVAFEFEDDALNATDLRKSLDYAAKRVGIGDYRPMFGRFTVEDWQIR